MVGRPGQMQPWMPRGDVFDFSHSFAMPHVILRTRFRPAIGSGQHRLRVNAHDGAQFLASQLDEGSVILLRQGFCASAADEDANQFTLVWCAMGKFL